MEKPSSLALIQGSVVRAPFDMEDDEAIYGDFRDFRVGRIVSLDKKAEMARVEFVHVQLGAQFVEKKDIPFGWIERCLLPENTPVYYREKKEKGAILCVEKLRDDYVHYYVQKGSRIEVISESDLYFMAHYQDPHPIDQLRRYELHHPIWRDTRNLIIESYREFQNTIFGIEDLVGTRVHLLNHQAEVIADVLSYSPCRFVLADEVGLGKTIEACVIIKSIRRREKITTLILAPRTLIRQWFNELNNKFWLKFQVIETGDDSPVVGKDTIISVEAFKKNPLLQFWAQMQDWGLLIIDEVHRIYLDPDLYEKLLILSELSRNVLLLSATPIQRTTDEYISLLKLLDPLQYSELGAETFSKMLNAQQKIREVVAYLAEDLNPTNFDAEEFQEEIGLILQELDHDQDLANMVALVKSDRDLDHAKDVIAYISTNYRLENRIIRNRRKILKDREQVIMPEREFTLAYAYNPSAVERQIYESLHTYVGICLGNESYIPLLRNLFQASSSSPFVLFELLELRRGITPIGLFGAHNSDLMEAFGAEKLPEEERLINDMLWLVEKWKEETTKFINQLPLRNLPTNPNHRLAQVIRAIDDNIRLEDNKILVFSAWHATLSFLEILLKRRYGKYRIAKFQAGMSTDELQEQVDRFQADPDCLILLTDESGGEGRNFQIAKIIIHIDLPWTPSRIEQRIGRVDRLGRDGTVLSIIPYAIDSLEADLVTIWQDAFQLFSNSMSGMEIILEGIQNQIFDAFIRHPRNGIANLRAPMINEAENLRKIVEEERYYEENAGNLEWSRQLRYILNRYNEKDVLGEPLRRWASLAGLHHHYNPKTQITWIGKADFNFKSIQNAKFIDPPNMEEALERSGRPNNQKLSGTFNRSIAVEREDIIFFAPGETWTDTILRNAVLSDRGRCCAIQRKIPDLETDWFGFEYCFSCKINPRFLFQKGLLPVHLFKAGEFFTLPAIESLLVSSEGQIMDYKSPETQAIKRAFSNVFDKHSGKRSGEPAPIQELKARFPPMVWNELIQTTYLVALRYLEDRYNEIIAEDAENARQILGQRIRGQLAALEWVGMEKRLERKRQVESMKHAADAIVNGISETEWRLESVCFWILKPE